MLTQARNLLPRSYPAVKPMISPQPGLKGLAGAIGFFFGALLLSALVGDRHRHRPKHSIWDRGARKQYDRHCRQCVWIQRPLQQHHGRFQYRQRSKRPRQQRYGRRQYRQRSQRPRQQHHGYHQYRLWIQCPLQQHCWLIQYRQRSRGPQWQHRGHRKYC